MHQSKSKSIFVGIAIGVAMTGLAALMMGQAANQPVKSPAEYFVTADGEGAHLWVREGVTLRVVGHGKCAECTAEDHDDHKHDHDKPATKK